MKRVLVLGAGMVAAPLVDYLHNHGHHLTIADINGEAARAIAGGRERTESLSLDISQEDRLLELINRADLVVSLLPPALHMQIARHCLAAEKHFLTASYLSEEMKALNQDVAAKDLIFFNEIGLDPGIDHLTAMEIIDDAKDAGYHIRVFDSHCGGIPSLSSANNPLRYKFSWSPAGVLGAITRAFRFRRNGAVVEAPGKDKLHHAEVLHVPGVGIFESMPNADSLYYGERYGLEDTDDVRRGTLRYPGWAQFWLFMIEMDFLNRERTLTFDEEPALQALFKLTGRTPPEDIYRFVKDQTDTHASVFLENMESLGLLDPENTVSGEVSAFDIVLAGAKQHLNYAPMETDSVVLHHEFIVEKDGVAERWTSTLQREGEPGGVTAMAFLVGVPAAIAARMILEHRIQDRGVMIPLKREVYGPILKELGELGLPHEIRKHRIQT